MEEETVIKMGRVEKGRKDKLEREQRVINRIIKMDREG